MTQEAFAQFNIQIGDALTWNVRPLLHEIRHALHALLESGQTSMIDLRSIPLAPGEETKLLEQLGRGELVARLDALGPSEIYETKYKGVWLVTHFNEDNSIMGRFIEVTLMPDILRSQRADMLDSLMQLEQTLAADAVQDNQNNNIKTGRGVN